MRNVDDILHKTEHRPWVLPSGRWQYYQEWNEALFMHWSVDKSWLKVHVPDGYEIDGFDGKYYISLIVFHMQHLHPRGLPALHFTSDFYQINCRTYVTVNGKSGVYFLNIEASTKFVALLAGTLSGLPYDVAQIQKKDNHYRATNSQKGRRLAITYQLGDPISNKSDLDIWLSEKYCLYKGVGPKIVRYDIHHPEWEFKNIDLHQMDLHYPVLGLNLGETEPDLIHYSEGIKVVSWGKQKAL